MSSSCSDAKGHQDDDETKNVVVADLTKDAALCQEAEKFGRELIRYAVSVIVVISDGIRIDDKPGGVYPGVMIGHTETTARIALTLTRPLKIDDRGRKSSYLYQICDGGDEAFKTEGRDVLFRYLHRDNKAPERKRDYIIAVEKAFKALIEREKEASLVSKSR
jgi:hypothetical protein